MKFLLVIIFSLGNGSTGVFQEELPTEALCIQIKMDIKSQIVANNGVIKAHGCYKI